MTLPRASRSARTIVPLGLALSSAILLASRPSAAQLQPPTRGASGQQGSAPSGQGTYPAPDSSYPPIGTPYPAQPQGYPNQAPATGYPNPTTSYPNPGVPYVNPGSPYPGAGNNGYSYPTDSAYGYGQMGQPVRPRLRDMFATSIATVLASSGAGVVSMIAQNLTGSISGWFDQRALRRHGYAVPARPSPYTAYATTGAPAADVYGTGAYAGTAGAGAVSNVTSGPPANAATDASVYPAPARVYPAPASVYPAPVTATSTAAVGTAGAVGGSSSAPIAAALPTSAPPSAGGSAYAGVAYEVHTVDPNGADHVVDTKTHTFATGDRFVVYYRPSLPGLVEVFNINPLKERTKIDSTSIAAGQLATLGPYEFTSHTGDETLELRLSPCTSDSLAAATRDIVKVSTPDATSQPGSLALPACGASATRAVKRQSRSIQTLGVDGTTSYALDPLSQQETSSGSYAARTLTITFHHH